MNRFVAGSVAALVLGCAAARAELPRGYKLVQLTSGPEYDNFVAMNNAGQVVFARRMDPWNTDTEEIFLYEVSTRTFTRLTNDNVRDTDPDINDAGIMVWSRGIGAPDQWGPTLEVMIRQPDGQVTRLTNDGLTDWGLSLNNLGHMAWYKWFDEGCQTASANIYFYDGQDVIAITNDDWSNVGPVINDLDEIVWNQRTFCVGPYWDAKIMLYSQEQITQISLNGVYRPHVTDMNNRGQVIWQFNHGDGRPYRGLQIWENGTTSLFSEWGHAGYLNESGMVYFFRWHNDIQSYEGWYDTGDGAFLRLTNDNVWDIDGDINELGEAAWQSGMYPEGDVRFLQRLPIGDLNCDGSVNAFDIEPFMLALGDGVAYAKTYPQCDIMLADGNGDGSVNQFDIQPFVELLSR